MLKKLKKLLKKQENTRRDLAKEMSNLVKLKKERLDKIEQMGMDDRVTSIVFDRKLKGLRSAIENSQKRIADFETAIEEMDKLTKKESERVYEKVKENLQTKTGSSDPVFINSCFRGYGLAGLALPFLFFPFCTSTKATTPPIASKIKTIQTFFSSNTSK